MRINGDCIVQRNDDGTKVQKLTEDVRLEWHRVLSDAEVQRVASDPYQAFRPSPRAR